MTPDDSERTTPSDPAPPGSGGKPTRADLGPPGSDWKLAVGCSGLVAIAIGGFWIWRSCAGG